jgi:hypothetical protein
MSVGTMGEKMHGRKRHLLTDTQGLVISVNVLAADLGDREGGNVLFVPLRGALPRLEVIWVESGSAGHPFEPWVKDHLGCAWRSSLILGPALGPCW